MCVCVCVCVCVGCLALFLSATYYIKGEILDSAYGTSGKHLLQERGVG
jgi:hypothetical protein